jgi:hypothetical protein
MDNICVCRSKALKALQCGYAHGPVTVYSFVFSTLNLNVFTCLSRNCSAEVG